MSAPAARLPHDALPNDLLTQVPEAAVRWIALAQLEELERASRRLADAKESEAVHDLRVALRRLRSTMRAWRQQLKGSVRARHRRALSELQAVTGQGRDAEVGARWVADLSAQLSPAELRGATWLRGRLVKQAARERKAIRQTLEADLPRLLRRLRRRLSSYAVQVGAPTEARAPRFAADVAVELRRHAQGLQRGLARLAGGDAAAAAHAARIEGKRLRYLLEPLVDCLPGAPATLARLKGLQDALGAIQDLVVLEAAVGRALEEAAVEHARKLHRAAERGRGPAGLLPRPLRDKARVGVLALARESAESRRQRLAAVAAGWRTGPAIEALMAEVETLAEAAEAQARAGFEIERKYLLRALPVLPAAAEIHEIEQGWLPGERLQERLRRVTVRGEIHCGRTLKLGRGRTRVEIEEACPPALFERLWPLTEGLRVKKRRHVVATGPRAWEIDEFLDRDLVLAEIELASADEVVELPDWLASYVVREVTDEAGYVNRRLAR